MADLETAEGVTFLEGKSEEKKTAWVSNYNRSRENALKEVEKRYIRT